MLKNNSGLVVSLIIGFFISLFYSLGLFNNLEQRLGYDPSFLVKRNSLPSDKVKVIGIDQKSLEMIGLYPWRRDLYAQLLDKLGKNPSVVAFDIILSELSEYPEDDILLSEKIKESGRVILPVILEPDPDNNEQLSFFYPLTEFSGFAKATGLVNTFPDSDGIVRSSPINFQLKDSNDKVSLFSYEVVKTYLKDRIELPEIVYTNYQGKEDAFTTYSFYDVISGAVAPETFKDSIVLVGALAEGMDRISSPIGPMSGVLFHAQMISNMLKDDYIIPVSKSINILLIFFVAVITFIFWKYFDTVNQILLIILSTVFLYAIHVALFSGNIWISIIALIITNTTTFMFLILFSQFKIAKSLKSELDRLITNYEKRNLSYRIARPVVLDKDEHNVYVKANTVDSNTQKISKLAEIGNTLTLERTFLETLLNNIKISIIVTDKNSTVMLTNPVAEKFFLQDELIGRRLVDIMGSFPDIKSSLISVFAGKETLPATYYGERGTSMYKLTLLRLEQEETLSNSNIICLIEDVTDWHQRVNTDGLTGLWNQRYFKDHLEKEINKYIRYKTPLSLIMMDVDHFKSFNDTYGHQTGDKVLKAIAEVLQKNVRNTDIAARYGGEEFSIILPMTDEDGALIFAERVRKDIEELEITDMNGNEVKRITSSLGIACYTEGSLSEFVEFADEALYTCKDRGRNCTVKYSQLVEEKLSGNSETEKSNVY